MSNEWIRCFLLVLAVIITAGCGGDDGGTFGPVTWTVIPEGGGNFQDIQSCIDQSNNGDTCLAYPGTYAPIRFNGKGIRVASNNGADVTFLDGNNTDTVVRFIDREGESSVLQGFTIRNGSAQADQASRISPSLSAHGIASPGEENGGGIKIWIASPIIRNCVIQDNHAQGNGGGVYCAFTGSRPLFRHVVFQDNTADGTGGGLSVFSALPDLEDCLFLGNQADKGGAVTASFGADVRLSNCTVADNTATSGGIALYLLNASASIEDSICGNRDDEEAWNPVPGLLSLDLSDDSKGPLDNQYRTSVLLDHVQLQGGAQSIEEQGDCLPDPDDRCTTALIEVEETYPLFVKLADEDPDDPVDDYYLSQEAAGDGQTDSPCLDRGKASAVRAAVDKRTTQNGQNGVQDPDEGVNVDLGFHYVITLP